MKATMLTRDDLKFQHRNLPIKELEIHHFIDMSFRKASMEELIIFKEDHDGKWDERLKYVYEKPAMYKILKSRY